MSRAKRGECPPSGLKTYRGIWTEEDDGVRMEDSSASCPRCGGKIVIRMDYREGAATWFQCVKCAYTPSTRQEER